MLQRRPDNAFGRVLRRVRRERDLTQEALAEKAGLAFKHLGEIERANRDPGLSTIIRLADALGIGLGDLFMQVEQERTGLAGA